MGWPRDALVSLFPFIAFKQVSSPRSRPTRGRKSHEGQSSSQLPPGPPTACCLQAGGPPSSPCGRPHFLQGTATGPGGHEGPLGGGDRGCLPASSADKRPAPSPRRSTDRHTQQGFPGRTGVTFSPAADARGTREEIRVLWTRVMGPRTWRDGGRWENAETGPGTSEEAGHREERIETLSGVCAQDGKPSPAALLFFLLRDKVKGQK